MVDMSIPPKRCSKCKQEFPATAEFFYPSAKYKSGFASQCRECRRQNKRRWYLNNRDHCLEYAKEYGEKNHEQILARVAKYQEDNREEINKRSRQRYAADPKKFRDRSRNFRLTHIEQARAYDKAYAQKHRERKNSRKRQKRLENLDEERRKGRESRNRRIDAAKAYGREYIKAHPDKNRAYCYKRRISHKGVSLNDKDIALQYKSQKGLCWWCGKRVGDKYHVDHRVPLSKGGLNVPENIVISCPFCNQSKHDKLPHEWNGRLL